MLKITWTDYTNKVAFENDNWATSDRGWAYITGYEHCCGNYLDYTGTHEGNNRPDAPISANAYYTITGVDNMKYTCNLGFGWFATIPDAKAFVEEKVTNHLTIQTT